MTECERNKERKGQSPFLFYILFIIMSFVLIFGFQLMSFSNQFFECAYELFLHASSLGHCQVIGRAILNLPFPGFCGNSKIGHCLWNMRKKTKSSWPLWPCHTARQGREQYAKGSSQDGGCPSPLLLIGWEDCPSCDPTLLHQSVVKSEALLTNQWWEVGPPGPLSQSEVWGSPLW